MTAPMFSSLGVWSWPAFIAFVAVCLVIGVALRRWEQKKGFRGGDGVDGPSHHDGGGGGHH